MEKCFQKSENSIFGIYISVIQTTKKKKVDANNGNIKKKNRKKNQQKLKAKGKALK